MTTMMRLLEERCADKCDGVLCEQEACSCLEWAKEKAEPPAFYTVAVYLEDQSYGGPEEGGWWYSCGELVYNLEEGYKNVAFPQTYRDRAAAVMGARLLNEGALKRLNYYRPKISSVLSKGRYVARVCDNYPEPFFPKERPCYE